MTYAILKLQIEEIEKQLDEKAQILRSYPRGAMGLVAEESKDAEYLKTKVKYNVLFKQLQKANAYKIKFYKQEYKEELNDQRAV